MTYPRSHLVDSEAPCFYHVISRCVRRAWLCGDDPETGRSFEHRRAWIEKRILYLAQFFSVDVYAYAVMSNHYHIVLYFDPCACATWSDQDVARRWLAVRAGANRANEIEDDRVHLESLLNDPQLVQTCRSRLGSLSWFMRCLNHPIACWANREDACTGHFWEGRFRSAVLLDEAAVLACMAYVDLNPVRAKIARRFDESRYTSIDLRLSLLTSNDSLSPLGVQQLHAAPSLPMTLNEYRELLLSLSLPHGPAPPELIQWSDRVASMRRHQRAHGMNDRLRDWVQRIGQHWTKAWALPA